MKITSLEEGLGCQSVFRVLGVLNADLEYHTRGEEEIDIKAVLTGSAALAEYADRNNVHYETDTKDVDLWTNTEHGNLEELTEFPLAEETRNNGSQYRYKTSSVSTEERPPQAFVDIITDYEEAFEWDTEEAREIEERLSNDISGDPVVEGPVEVYLPSIDVLEDTFRYSGKDYTDRIEFIQEIKE